MSPQLIQIAECLNEANTREIKIARCLAESLKRIQELEQSKTEASQQAKEAEKRFSAALHDLAEQLTKTGEETTSIAQHLSNQINTEKEQFSSELGNVVDLLTKTSEQAKVEFGYKVDEIALKLAELPAQMAAFKAEFAIPSVQADAPKSFNPRGAYENGEKYKPFDYVSANGSSYIALVENPTEPPSKRSKQWMLVAAKGASGSGGIISASEVVGLGTAAFRDVGQEAGNVLELSGTAQITVGDGINPGQIIFASNSGNIDLRNEAGQFVFTNAGDEIFMPVGTGTIALTAEVKSANFSAALDGEYVATATLTVTDPSPAQGKGFTVFVRNGTATVGGVAYATAGTTIRRVYHSGAWANYSGSGSVAVGDITGLGTGVATALAVNTGSAGAFVTLNGALGTPSSGTVTNLTGTASININGTVGATTPASGAFTTVTSSSTTDSSSGTTGGVVVSGGLGVAKSVSLGATTGAQLRFFGGNGNAQFESWTAQSGTGIALKSYHGFQVTRITGVSSTLLDVFDNTSGNPTTPYFRIRNSGGDFFQVGPLGNISLAKTITAAGTTGAQTINKSTGTVNLAAAATSLVVTNSLVATSSIIVCTVGTNDTTMKSVAAVAAAGSFTLYPDAAPTAETRVNFIVTN